MTAVDVAHVFTVVMLVVAVGLLLDTIRLNRRRKAAEARSRAARARIAAVRARSPEDAARVDAVLGRFREVSRSAGADLLLDVEGQDAGLVEPGAQHEVLGLQRRDGLGGQTEHLRDVLDQDAERLRREFIRLTETIRDGFRKGQSAVEHPLGDDQVRDTVESHGSSPSVVGRAPQSHAHESTVGEPSGASPAPSGGAPDTGEVSL